MVKRALWAGLVAAAMATGGMIARRLSATIWRRMMGEAPPTRKASRHRRAGAPFYMLVDFAASVAGPLSMLRHIGAGRPVVERARLGPPFWVTAAGQRPAVSRGFDRAAVWEDLITSGPCCWNRGGR